MNVVKWLNRFQVGLAVTMSVAAVAAAVTLGPWAFFAVGLSASVCWLMCD